MRQRPARRRGIADSESGSSASAASSSDSDAADDQPPAKKKTGSALVCLLLFTVFTVVLYCYSKLSVCISVCLYIHL